MLFRTRLIATLLDSNLTLWLTESDAVWLRDPTDQVLGTSDGEDEIGPPMPPSMQASVAETEAATPPPSDDEAEVGPLYKAKHIPGSVLIYTPSRESKL